MPSTCRRSRSPCTLARPSKACRVRVPWKAWCHVQVILVLLVILVPRKDDHWTSCRSSCNFDSWHWPCLTFVISDPLLSYWPLPVLPHHTTSSKQLKTLQRLFTACGKLAMPWQAVTSLSNVTETTPCMSLHLHWLSMGGLERSLCKPTPRSSSPIDKFKASKNCFLRQEINST